jgi:hypothetical protein
MRIIITESQFRDVVVGDIDELSTRKKELYGWGMSHKVYPSLSNPDVLYKVGKIDIVNKWVKTFESNPKIFPIIYKVGDIGIPIKNFNGKVIGHEPSKYVMIEKLDNVRAEKDFEMLDNFFEENSDYSFGMGILDLKDSGNDLYDMGQLMHKLNPTLFRVYIKFLRLIVELQNYKEFPDLHRGQFGYDKKNNLKCLDF